MERSDIFFLKFQLIKWWKRVQKLETIKTKKPLCISKKFQTLIKTQKVRQAQPAAE